MGKQSNTRKPHARRIKLLRTQMGWSQRELARNLGVSPSAVAHWETGEREISGPVQKLLEIFESKAKKVTKNQ
jgi:DNA-binding transcriptional regulator YiaG